MTDDASPENLRKFLESDDPAMVRMGIAMARGIDCPDELMNEILWIYLFHKDKDIRVAAKAVLSEQAPESVREAVENNWKASYRTLSVTGDKFVPVVNGLHEKIKDRDGYSILGFCALRPFMKALEKSTNPKGRIAALNTILGLPFSSRSFAAVSNKDIVELLVDIHCRHHTFAYHGRKTISAHKKAGEIALEVLNIVGGAAVSPLIEALKDKRAFQNAAVVLGIIGDSSSVKPLIETLEDKEIYYRHYAAEALGKIGDPSAIKPLIKALGDDGSDVAASAAIALGQIGKVPAINPLVKALETDFLGDYHSNAYAQRAAAWALGEIGNKRAINPLINALEDDAGFAHLDSAKAIGKIDLELLKSIQSDKKNKVVVRQVATTALSESGGEENEDVFIRMLLEEEKKGLRSTAAEALGEMCSERAVEPLIEALEDDISEAADALGKISDARGVEPLIRALESRKGPVRKAAILALGKIGDARAIPPLVQVSKFDEVVSARKEAVRALGDFDDESVIEPLMEALSENSSTIRKVAESALRAIGESQVPKRNKVLIKALKSDNFITREIAAKLLGGSGDLRALKPLQKALSLYYSEDYRVKFDSEYARRGLGPLARSYTNRSMGEGREIGRILVAIKELEKRQRENEAKAAGWEFESSSQPGKFYVVTKKGDALVCNCKGFRYKGNCSHIKQVIERDEDKLDVELVQGKKFSAVLDSIEIKIANHLIKELELKAEGKKVNFKSNEQLKIITEKHPDFEFPVKKKQAIDLLLYALQNEKLRGRAAYSLGKIGEKRAVEPLLNHVWKGDLDTVLEVIDALGAIGDSKVIEPLENLLRTAHNYKDSSRRLNVRIRTAEALALFGPKGVHTLARELGNEYHGEAIDVFILALGKVCESSTDEYEKEVAAEAIVTVLRNTEPNVRYHFDDRLRLAALTLGKIEHPISLKPLREKLREIEAVGPNPNYQSITIQVRPTPSDGAPEWLLESIKEAIETIGAAKKARDKPKVKEAAAKARRGKKVLAEALATLPPKVRKEFEKNRADEAVLSNPKATSAQKAAAKKALDKVKAKEAAAKARRGKKVIAEMLAALPPKLRKAAEKEIAAAGKQPQKIAPMRLSKRNETSDAHLEPIIKELGDSEHLTRAAAARTLGKIGDARAIEALTKALGDENKYVRKYAKEALKKLGHEVE